MNRILPTDAHRNIYMAMTTSELVSMRERAASPNSHWDYTAHLPVIDAELAIRAGVPDIKRRPVTGQVKRRLRWNFTALTVAIVALALGFGAGVAVSTTIHDNTALNHGGLPRCTDAIADAGGACWGEPLAPCPTEDSVNCYWDASTMGNGRGTDFISE